MEKSIQNKLPQIAQLMRMHHVKHAYAFGSAITGTENVKSDLNFVIAFSEEMDYKTYGDNYACLLYELQALLHREIDLVANETLTNPFVLEIIDNHKIKIV